jgi:hypothetical protein
MPGHRVHRLAVVPVTGQGKRRRAVPDQFPALPVGDGITEAESHGFLHPDGFMPGIWRFLSTVFWFLVVLSYQNPTKTTRANSNFLRGGRLCSKF